MRRMSEIAQALARQPESLQSEYDVVIVGSGYGGAITAARLGVANAEAGGKLKIAVLESGAEYPTGTFPESQQGAVSNLRSARNPLGLFQIDRHSTVDVIHANGLGGTSLMNFNVAIVPDREVFLASWPRPFQELVQQSPSGVGGLDEYYDRANRMLGANRFIDGETLPRVDVFTQIAKHAGAAVVPLNITVSKKERLTRYGVQRRSCPMHGGDGTGDNTFSKNTLMTNYLPMARHFGVELFTCVEVDRVEQNEDGGWRIIANRRTGPRGRETSEVVVNARRVVLSAGTMGTNGILLRSREAGLALSSRLGKNFSGNGDNFGIAYNTDMRTDTQAWASDDTPPRSGLMCGPSITVAMRFGADQADLRKRFTVEDLSLPRALVDVFRVGLMGLAATRYPHLDKTKLNRWRRDVVWNTDGAMNHSLGFLIMVHDNSDGELVLSKDGSVSIDWPGAPTERMYKDVDDILQPAVEAIGGTYIKNPWWANAFFGNHLITAHPMGGCATGDNVDGGVVDHAGRVFRPDGGTHDGLYVRDGSVIPRALGVNPFLTISMFAERAAEILREDLGLPAYDPAVEGED
jgi:cholesterol oxidase